MSPKMGRPKVENPINIKTTVRLDVKTDEELSIFCKKYNLTKGEAIRMGIKQLLERDKK